MLTPVRSLLAATVLAGSVLAATPAMAQDEDTSPVTITGNVSLVTDYRFRGVGLSGGNPAIQGGLTATVAPGFYAGFWGSNLEDSNVYGEIELDLYGGWAGMLTENVGVDVGATYYAYPSNEGGGPADVIEFYGKVKPTLGPVALTLAAYYSPDQDSLGGGDNLYLAADAGISIPGTPISVTGHVGYTDGFLVYTADGDAFDYSVGASVTVLGGLSLGVSYVGVDGPTGPAWDGITDDTVVGSIGFSF